VNIHKEYAKSAFLSLYVANECAMMVCGSGRTAVGKPGLRRFLMIQKYIKDEDANYGNF